MPSEGDTFLPRIQSVFYAVFDLRQGPKIVYQVPEGLIAASPAGLSSVTSNTPSVLSLLPSTPVSAASDGQNPRKSSSPLNAARQQNPRHIASPPQRSVPSNRTLFNFDDISKYVIPPSALCGRLVTCATRHYRVVGFPTALRGNYERNYFRYNICFVFERAADLSCYEPIVRKVGRVLTACEEESAFLSSPHTSPAVHAILEQLYEDLNSYSETSIAIDKFNSIELKIFPFYPNPPPVKDWMVPLALIDLSKRIEPNWDLTMVKVINFIDGVNHVTRIAQLADCDLELTREAISHLLYHQVIMTIDIFQYSNMYTLRKSIQWLANEPHVIEECGPYVTRPGRVVPHWPQLLHLYSRMRPGKTVLEWMEAHQVHELGIDVRRFTSFGVIKGFLRRVHRWPILLSRAASKAQQVPPSSPAHPLPSTLGNVQSPTLGSDTVPNSPTTERPSTVVQVQGRTSTAELALEQLRFRTIPKSAAHSARQMSETTSESRQRSTSVTSRDARRDSLTQPGFPSIFSNTPSHMGLLKSQNIPIGSVVSPSKTTSRLPLSRSPSTTGMQISEANLQQSQTPVPHTQHPPELVHLLDGEHHTDELSTRFEAGWPCLQQWLVDIGGGNGNGDFGRVLIIYR